MVVEISYSPWFMKDIKNNARVTVNNDFFVTREAIRQWFSLVTNNNFFCHEWGDSTMIFTSDEVTSENHCRIASRVTKKSLFTVTNVLFYILHAILCHKSAKNYHRTLISPLLLRAAFSDRALWRHHNWSVTSCEREILVLWRHICLLSLHAQIVAKAIFTSE